MSIKKNWKNRRAVSPVIATILMVAITVVLAAVLYVMVMGFGTNTTTIPAGVFATPTATSATVEQIQVTSMNPTTKMSDTKLVITNSGGSARYVCAAGTSTLALDTSQTALTGVTIAWNDLAGDNNIGAGDYVTITMGGTAATGAYTVALLTANGGNQICSASFTH